MIIFTTILLGLWALLLGGHRTPIGAAMHLWLVAVPATLLSRIHRNTVLSCATLAILGLACFWVIGHEGIIVFSMGMPELATVLAMVDLGLLLDIGLMTLATIAGGGWQVARAFVSRVTGRPRAPRTRRSRPARKPAANDDEGGRGWALAA